jgi:hypothetical protein
MGYKNSFEKDPQAIWPYTINYVNLLPTGETISSVTWTVPNGLTKVSQANTTTTATAVLSGGTAGQQYEVLCHITTTPGGYEDDRTIIIKAVPK